MFGEIDIDNELVGQYLGTDSSSIKLQASQGATIVDSRDAKLAYYENLASRNDADDNVYEALLAELKHREDTDAVFAEVFAHFRNSFFAPIDSRPFRCVDRRRCFCWLF